MDWRNNLLNIRSKDYKEDIYKIVSEEKQELQKKLKLLNGNNDLTGFCIYIADRIEERLNNLGIKTYLINLLDINVEHVFLICEYRYQDKMIRYLIDPTYEQFTKSPNKTLIGLPEWPSEKLDKTILDELLNKGLVELNNYVLNNYLNSFNFIEINIDLIDLDEYLLNIRTNKISKR